MTISTQANRIVYLGNGATTSFSYSFLIPAQSDLQVSLVDAESGDETILNPIAYSVTGLGNPVGGQVTYPLSGSPLTLTTYIVVQRILPYTQEVDLLNQGAVYPEDIEDGLDTLCMQIQQLADVANRSIVFSDADTVTQTLPPAPARANLQLGFDSTGAPIAVASILPSVQVSSAMIPVVTAPSTAAALTELGLPGALLDLLIPSGVCWEYDAGGVAPTGFVFPIGQACTSTYPNYRAKLIAAGSPYGTNGTDPLMPDRRSTVGAGKSNMGGADNGLLTGGTVLGAVLGNQSKTIVVGNLPPYTPTGTNAASGGSATIHALAGSLTGGYGNSPGATPNSVPGYNGATDIVSISFSANGQVFTGAAQGGTSTPFSLVQPTFICNFILKVH